jgi:hypothetical protein
LLHVCLDILEHELAEVPGALIPAQDVVHALEGHCPNAICHLDTQVNDLGAQVPGHLLSVGLELPAEDQVAGHPQELQIINILDDLVVFEGGLQVGCDFGLQ